MFNLKRTWLHSAIGWHLYALFQYLDPVEDCSRKVSRSKVSSYPEEEPTKSTKPRTFDYKFLPQFLLMSCTLMYGIFGLQRNYFHLFKMAELKQLLSSPYLIIRQPFPPEMWPQSDGCVLGGALACICVYLTFVFNPIDEKKYKMSYNSLKRKLVIGSSKELCQQDSDKIRSFRAKYKTPILASIILFDCSAMVYFYLCIWRNQTFETNMEGFTVWLVFFPRFIFDIIYALFVIIIFVIMTSKYLQIRQKRILAKLDALNRKISKASAYNCSASSLHLYWDQYISLNRQLMAICWSIEVYSLFWTPYLSIILPFYVWVQTYLAYIFFFVDRLTFVQKYIFLYGVIEIDLCLFLLIDQCARVVSLNQRILKANRTFALLIRRKQATLGLQLFGNRALLLAESLQDSKRLHPYGFRLFGNYRITSKTFHLVISYISMFFLLVIMSQKMQNQKV